MKRFNVFKFIDDMKPRCTEEVLIGYLENFALENHGKTKEQLIEMGCDANDEWFDEIAEDNKYQIALDNICKTCNGEYLCGCVYKRTPNIKCKNYETIQELINNMKFVEEVQTPDYIRVQKELWESKK